MTEPRFCISDKQKLFTQTLRFYSQKTKRIKSKAALSRCDLLKQLGHSRSREQIYLIIISLMKKGKSRDVIPTYQRLVNHSIQFMICIPAAVKVS